MNPFTQFQSKLDRKRLHCCGVADVIVIQQGQHRSQHAILDHTEAAEILRQYEAIEAWHSHGRSR